MCQEQRGVGGLQELSREWFGEVVWGVVWCGVVRFVVVRCGVVWRGVEWCGSPIH